MTTLSLLANITLCIYTQIVWILYEPWLLSERERVYNKVVQVISFKIYAEMNHNHGNV